MAWRPPNETLDLPSKGQLQEQAAEVQGQAPPVAQGHEPQRSLGLYSSQNLNQAMLQGPTVLSLWPSHQFLASHQPIGLQPVLNPPRSALFPSSAGTEFIITPALQHASLMSFVPPSQQQPREIPAFAEGSAAPGAPLRTAIPGINVPIPRYPPTSHLGFSSMPGVPFVAATQRQQGVSIFPVSRLQATSAPLLLSPLSQPVGASGSILQSQSVPQPHSSDSAIGQSAGTQALQVERRQWLSRSSDGGILGGPEEVVAASFTQQPESEGLVVPGWRPASASRYEDAVGAKDGEDGAKESQEPSLSPDTGQHASKKCAHNRQKNKCKECRGTGICEHNRLRRMCKDCGGVAICKHKRQWAICTECGGSQICEHKRRKSRCKECGGVQICQHMRRRSRCKECGGSAICEHSRERRLCKECKGSGICEHLRQRRFCKQCKAEKLLAEAPNSSASQSSVLTAAGASASSPSTPQTSHADASPSTRDPTRGLPNTSFGN